MSEYRIVCGVKWTRMWWLLLLALAAVPVCIWAGSAGNVVGADPTPLPTGKSIRPVGQQTDVGSYPANMALSPDGAYIVVTDTGFRQQLSVLNARTGALVTSIDANGGKKGLKPGLYYGLAFGNRGVKTMLYASRGSEGTVAAYELSSEGTLTPAGEWRAFERRAHHGPVVAGVAASADGRRIYAVDNNTCEETGLKGILSVIDASSGFSAKHIEVPGFPLAVASLVEGQKEKVYVTSERDGVVALVDPVAGKVVKRISVGAGPTSLAADVDRHRLYVSNSGADTVSVIDTQTDRVSSTLLVRPPELRGLPGATPLGLCVSPDGSRLFVSLADLNAVAIVDASSTQILGYVSAGWYPTAACLSVDGTRLLVSNAKGVAERNPNAKPSGPDGKWGQYVEDLLEGTVSTIDVSGAMSNLPALTEEALANNNLSGTVGEQTFANPGIRHVIYVIKENRTYDQVLGDLGKGNGDPSICLFPREVTPNQHALAERFVLLDNFYCCAEVSADGWNWSTSGMANEYVSRNAPYNYSGRGRSYDFEGENNEVVVADKKLRDVAEAPGGYIWDLCRKHGVSNRNYGFFIRFDAQKGPKDDKAAGRSIANKKALADVTDPSFRQFDMAYPDSDASRKLGLRLPGQMETFGDHGARSRFEEWKLEFDDFVKEGKMPQFTMLRLPRDHTAGTRAGTSSPRAMVADNDYAVGQLVEAVSHSPFWKSTLICVLEDDAQDGYDHVDAHRSTAYVISPFVKPGLVDSHFYNTDSMLRTMELALGLPPMNGYDAVAPILDVLDSGAANAAPYAAILPTKSVIGDLNGSHAYRSADSKRMLRRFSEESRADEELNDILWGSIKGARSLRPTVRHGVRLAADR